jgi:AraC-like DNA-binding protein
MLLAYPDLPIRDIAAAVGYDDPLYFSRLFSRKVGIYPSDYRSKGGDASDAPPPPNPL